MLLSRKALCPPFVSLVLVSLLLAAPTHAQVFRWTDDNGVTHFSDSPPGKDGQPRQMPKANSSVPMRRNNATLRRKLPDPEPRRQSRNNNAYQIKQERQIAAEEAQLRQQCKYYVRRIEKINDILRAGGYSSSYGNRLRAERRELSSKRAWECLFKD